MFSRCSSNSEAFVPRYYMGSDDSRFSAKHWCKRVCTTQQIWYRGNITKIFSWKANAEAFQKNLEKMFSAFFSHKYTTSIYRQLEI